VAHKGRFYPHIRAIDFRFPQPPWRVPPQKWILQGVTFTGNYAGDFPAQPWTVGLTSDGRAGGIYQWVTNFPVVSGRTPSVKIEIAFILPSAWLGCHLSISSGGAGSNTVVYAAIPGADFSGITFSFLRSSTQPANLTLVASGSAIPKPW